MKNRHPNEQLLNTFYTAFAARDHQAMQSCYAPDVEFEDPVFKLRGQEVGAMWHMLCESGTDLVVATRSLIADGMSGRAHLEANYTFSSSHRPVHNVIEAEFRFAGGLITVHNDKFNFWRWSSMALGPTGLLLGWTPMLQQSVRATARQRLNRFIEAHPEYKS